jgi:hypothetical protein
MFGYSYNYLQINNADSFSRPTRSRALAGQKGKTHGEGGNSIGADQ